MSVVRQFGMIIGASLLLAAAGTGLANAGVTCADFPDWCPAALVNIHHQHQPPGGDQSTPAPGALGLLALGAGVGIARMRRRNKKN